MKTMITFIKDRIIIGLIVLVPIIVIGIIIADSIKKIMDVTAPLTKKFSFGGLFLESTVAIILILLIFGLFFFISGLILKTYLGNSFKNWLENKVFEKIPFYNTIKSITKQFAGIEKKNYPVVEVDLYGNKTKSLGLMTETLPDERCVVYLPYAPLMTIGQVQIVSKKNVKVLDISFKDFSEIISKIGFEANNVLIK